MAFNPPEAKCFFVQYVAKKNYTYGFSWLGSPIIQLPQDIVAFQELVSEIDPQLILETGIAHGGSLVLSASVLCIHDLMHGRDPRASNTKVVGVDIDIRPHNRQALDEHPLRFKMELIEGSSFDPEIIHQVRSCTDGANRVLLPWNFHHAHEHVSAVLSETNSELKKPSARWCEIGGKVLKSCITSASAKKITVILIVVKLYVFLFKECISKKFRGLDRDLAIISFA